MNSEESKFPEPNPSPQELLEAQITALLLGELPEAEAAALRERIAGNAELVKLHARLGMAIGLVKEAIASPEPAELAAPEGLRISEEKRERLLAAFKTVAAPVGVGAESGESEKREKKKLVQVDFRTWGALAAMIVFLMAFSGMFLPPLAKSKSKAKSLTLSLASGGGQYDRSTRPLSEEERMEPGAKRSLAELSDSLSSERRDPESAAAAVSNMAPPPVANQLRVKTKTLAGGRSAAGKAALATPTAPVATPPPADSATDSPSAVGTTVVGKPAAQAPTIVAAGATRTPPDGAPYRFGFYSDRNPADAKVGSQRVEALKIELPTLQMAVSDKPGQTEGKEGFFAESTSLPKDVYSVNAAGYVNVAPQAGLPLAANSLEKSDANGRGYVANGPVIENSWRVNLPPANNGLAAFDSIQVPPAGNVDDARAATNPFVGRYAYTVPGTFGGVGGGFGGGGGINANAGDNVALGIEAKPESNLSLAYKVDDFEAKKDLAVGQPELVGMLERPAEAEVTRGLSREPELLVQKVEKSEVDGDPVKLLFGANRPALDGLQDSSGISVETLKEAPAKSSAGSQKREESLGRRNAGREIPNQVGAEFAEAGKAKLGEVSAERGDSLAKKPASVSVLAATPQPNGGNGEVAGGLSLAPEVENRGAVVRDRLASRQEQGRQMNESEAKTFPQLPSPMPVMPMPTDRYRMPANRPPPPTKLAQSNAERSAEGRLAAAPQPNSGIVAGGLTLAPEKPQQNQQSVRQQKVFAINVEDGDPNEIGQVLRSTIDKRNGTVDENLLNKRLADNSAVQDVPARAKDRLAYSDKSASAPVSREPLPDLPKPAQKSAEGPAPSKASSEHFASVVASSDPNEGNKWVVLGLPSAEIEKAIRDLKSEEKVRESVAARIEQEKQDKSTGNHSKARILDRAEAEPEKSGFLDRYRGVSRKSVIALNYERETNSLQSRVDTRGAYDPYFVQSEAELVKSLEVLNTVVEKLNLTSVWAARYGGGKKLQPIQAAQILRKMVETKSPPNSSNVEIIVKSDKADESAKIANTIAETVLDIHRRTQSGIGENGVAALQQELGNLDQKIAEKKATLEKLVQAQGVEDKPVAPKPSVNAAIPQPEVAVGENAFSTFSLNVSDVSYKLAAASLEKGVLPEAAGIRSEEFINAFDYRDPAAVGSAPVAFAWERARFPFAQDRDLLRFSVKTGASGREAGRPLNLVLLLDNSGSMERADRVRIIQECLRVLAGQLQAQDVVSVVTFARTARLRVDGLAGNQAGDLAARVGEFTPEGGTNLEEAMRLAYETAAKHFAANGVNRVVLLTDGAANLGDVEPESLKKSVEAHRKQGVALDCFGIGWEGLNDDLLEQLSRNGDGRYGFVNSPEEASGNFAGQLAGALHVAASDVKVQVEFNPKRTSVYRQIGYAKHQLTKEQFRDNTVDAAELGAAEAGNALYVVQTNPAGEGPIATVRVRFKVPGTTDYREHEWAVPYEGGAKALEGSSAAMRLAACAGEFSEWLAANPYAAEVTPDRLVALMANVPEAFPNDPRPKQLEWMIRQAKSVAGK